MRHKTSLANKRRWASIPADERSKKMSKLVKQRHKNSTPAQRKKLGLFLAKARRKAKRAKL